MVTGDHFEPDPSGPAGSGIHEYQLSSLLINDDFLIFVHVSFQDHF
jgi:hypothetical protein